MSHVRYAALLRGVNLGSAKRVAMADLRALFEDLGFEDVRTLLNSGNVVFSGRRATTSAIAAKIEKAIASRLGVSTRTTVLSAADVAGIARDNPLLEHANTPSHLHVAFFREPAAGKRLAPVTSQDWSPDKVVAGKHAAYLWFPNGMAKSKLPLAIEKALRDDVTVRTWGTVTKMMALLERGE